eukprot:5421119-Amphidinium_carterae.1
MQLSTPLQPLLSSSKMDGPTRSEQSGLEPLVAVDVPVDYSFKDCFTGRTGGGQDGVSGART